MSETMGRMSAERWNRIVDHLIQRALEMRQMVIEQLLVAGYPPGARPLTPEEEYERLASMRDARDPNFWNSAKAQQRLMDLEQRYASPPMPVSPLGAVVPPSSPPTFGGMP